MKSRHQPVAGLGFRQWLACDLFQLGDWLALAALPVPLRRWHSRLMPSRRTRCALDLISRLNTITNTRAARRCGSAYEQLCRQPATYASLPGPAPHPAPFGCSYAVPPAASDWFYSSSAKPALASSAIVIQYLRLLADIAEIT